VDVSPIPVEGVKDKVGIIDGTSVTVELMFGVKAGVAVRVPI
jgi:hypothetical protein